ncbi:hypothetical protein QBC32DRAFT_348161 [Pseudoneurospora amorphoporcata]|uniref:Uncharacterized protein n=1 Tax=Pseudoneurospora amorphoporcata TaxID=241081 RepID=A0AAN6NQ91_9PEZI|nr:hypothetical protein QBC32DRAFT_348161 [Pseudoneurospora amorphoporcata]
MSPQTPPPSSLTRQPLVLAAAASTLAEKARSTSQLIEKTLLPPHTSSSNSDPTVSKPDPSNPYPSSPSLIKLTYLSAKLLQFNQHANTLGDCITSASNSGVADVLAKTLDHALARCDQGVEVVKEQVEFLVMERNGVAKDLLQLQLHPETGTPGEQNCVNGVDGVDGETKGQKGKKRQVDGQVVQEYEDLLIAYSRLFIFGSQIVILTEKQQAEWMAKKDVDKIIDKAEESAKKVLAGKRILTQ